MNRWYTKMKRWQRLSVTLLLGVFMVGMTLFILWSNAFAGYFAGGAGGCGNFGDSVAATEVGDAVFQMIPTRDSGGAVITKDMRIMGGWFPTVNCAAANQVFSTTADFLDYGFEFRAPDSRSGLDYNGSVLTLEDPSSPNFPTLDKLIIEHMTLQTFGTPVEGGGINGIISDSAEVLLDNLFFDTNYARDYGGGLKLEVWGNSSLRIEDSLFDLNEADDFNGGGFYVELHHGSRMTIENTIFTNNTAIRGGAFEIHLFDDSELFILNSEFHNNSTQLVTNSAGGGYIFMEGGRVIIENSHFSSQNTGQNGGGLYIISTDGDVKITNTAFDGNMADNQPDSKGGGLYAEMDGGTMTIQRGTFANNEATGAGGGVYVESVGASSTMVNIIGAEFTNNTPNNYQFVQSGSGALDTVVLGENIYLPAILNDPQPVQTARILSITLNANNDYVVAFDTDNYEPVMPGTHVHFFFDNVPVEDAGMPADEIRWIAYGGSSPFTQYGFADRVISPYGAEKMCILVANQNHSIRPGTGNCVKLP